MKKMIFVLLAALVTINIWASEVTPANQLPTYYSNLENLSGINLVNAVTTTARKNYSGRTYANLWTDFCTTDIYPADSTDKAGKLWDPYSNVLWTCGSKQCGNYSDVGDCYNREHSLPKSWFGVGNKPGVGPGTDLYHMYPTDGYVNNQRSNYPFGECTGGTTLSNGSNVGSGRLGTSTLEGFTGGTVFEPNDEFKGDFARTYFYMVLAWCNYNNQTYSFTQETNGERMFNDDFTASGHFGLTDYSVALLMKWHRLDPVSRKETDRNNAVQSIQGNRNPFIDYPELAEYIWGAHAGETFTINSGDTPGEVCTRLATPNVTATAGDGQVTLAWTAVNGATNYTVTISAGEGFTTECLTEAVISNVTTNGSNCTCVISGLTNGLTYTTTVIAVANDKTCDSDADTDKVTPKAGAVVQYANYQVKHYQQNIEDNLYTLFETEDFNGLVGTQVTPAVKNYTGFVAPATQTKAITADGNMVINYNYNRQTYQIRFLNETVVLQDEQLKYGDTPVYKGDTPTKAETEQYIYTFDSWEPEVTLVTKSQDYVAFFIGEEKHSTAISTIVADKNDIRKVIINGLLFIQRGEHIYDVTGRLVK